MKALTIKQPWVWGITDHTKRVENRTWKPPYDLIGQRIALHAGKSQDKNDMIAAWGIATINVPSFTLLPLGAIVATAVIRGYVIVNNSGGVVEQSRYAENYDPRSDPWFFGPVGWLLEDVQKLLHPIPCKGALGLWDVPVEYFQEKTP